MSKQQPSIEISKLKNHPAIDKLPLMTAGDTARKPRGLTQKDENHDRAEELENERADMKTLCLAFTASVLENQNEPIAICESDEPGIWWIVDGRDRVRALKSGGKERVLFREIPVDQAEKLILGNILRKPYSQNQRAWAATEGHPEVWENQQAGRKPKLIAAEIRNCFARVTRSELADQWAVDQRLIDHACKIRRLLKLVESQQEKRGRKANAAGVLEPTADDYICEIGCGTNLRGIITKMAALGYQDDGADDSPPDAAKTVRDAVFIKLKGAIAAMRLRAEGFGTLSVKDQDELEELTVKELTSIKSTEARYFDLLSRSVSRAAAASKKKGAA